MARDLLYDLHKPVRNRIRKLEPVSLIYEAVSKLAIYDKNPTERRYLPWELLLLIKWVLLYHEPSPRLTKVATEVDLNRCIIDLKDMNKNIKLPPQKSGEKTEPAHKLRRRRAFQRFPYHSRIYEVKDVIARQQILFVDLGGEYKISKRFQGITGIEVNNFLLLCFATWALLNINKNQRLTVKNFSNFAESSEVQHFLDMLSLDLCSGRKCFEEDISTKKKTFEVQLYELTPLTMYPFFNDGSNVSCYSKALFNITLSNYVHNLLKERDSNFSKDFGAIFEQYIEKGLKYLGCEYLDERQIKGLLPRGSKKVDFLLPHTDCTILVEVKSADMHHIAKVLQTTESLTKNLDDSVIKAVSQIFEVAHHLQSSGPSNSVHNTEQFYGIVVTHEDYYLGASTEVWTEFIGHCVKPELVKKGISPDLIPSENLHYISAKEFDYMVEGLRKVSNLSMPQLLETIGTNNASTRTAKWMFVQHLEEIFGMNYYSPDYLEKRFEEMYQEAENRLKS